MAWRDGNRGGGRGGGGGHHFDNIGFGHRGGGMQGRGFRGRGGFNRGGPRGPPPNFAMRGGPRFRMPMQDMPWPNPNQNGDMHQMQMDKGEMEGPNVWAEATTGDGKSYFYHTQTRETTWERPEGHGIRIIRHENLFDKASGGGAGNTQPMNIDDASNRSRTDESQMSLSSEGGSSRDVNMDDETLSTTPSDHDFEMKRSSSESEMTSLKQSPHFQENPPMMNNNNLKQGGPPNMNSGPNPGQMHFPPIGFPMNFNAPPGNFPGPNDGPPNFPHFRGKGPNFGDNNSDLMGGPPGPPGLIGPFPGPGLGPPFATHMPPPNAFGQNFSMVPPPPWGMPGGGGMVPPPAIQVDPIIAQIDPKIVSKAYEWTQHMSPEGKSYFYNAKTQISVWEKPLPLVEFEAAKIATQQKMSVQQSPLKKNEVVSKTDSNQINELIKGKDSKKIAIESKKPIEKCRPISSTPVPGTPWCVVWTGDKRVFFYNPSSKQSVWDKPSELVGRYDVEELLRNIPTEPSSPSALPPLGSKVKKVEATSTTSPPHKDVEVPNLITIKPILSVGENSNKEKRDDEQSEKEPPLKKVKIDQDNDKDIEIIGETIVLENNESSADDKQSKESANEDKDEKDKSKDSLKGVNALEAEVKAARERAIVPMDIRLNQFKEMLIEKQVSAFSTWEKELHKIVFDQRYLLLTSKERKTAFDNFVKERAEAERKEKKGRLKAIRDDFMDFLKELNLPLKMTYNEFTQKYGRDERYKMVEKSRDRENYFCDFMSEIKKKDKESRERKKEKAREDFLLMIKDDVDDYRIKWIDVRKKYEGLPRESYDLLDDEDRDILFRAFQKELKSQEKQHEKWKKRMRKEKEREKRKEKEKRSKGEKKSSKDKSNEEKEKESKHEKKSDEESDVNPAKVEESESKKVDEISDEEVEEDEEGCISSDTDEEVRLEKEKKERAELSMREREKEVQRELATHLRDRDKEREFFRHEEAVQEFQAIMADLFRSIDVTWKDFKKTIKKDPRWASVSILSRDEMEDLFNQHSDTIARKKKLRFRELLQEARVNISSRWRDVRKKIKDDSRYTKFSNSERKCEREFELYLKDMSATMKSDYRELLKETKMLTYKTKQQVRENPHIMKDIESLLSKDKRYLELDTMSEERHRLLIEYLDDLERKGPPPPPTASEPNRRLKQ